MSDVNQPATDDAGASQADHLDKAQEIASPSAATDSQSLFTASPQQVEDPHMTDQVSAVKQALASSMDDTTTELPTSHASQPVQEILSISYEPAEVTATDSADRVTTPIPDSPEFSPEPAGKAVGHVEAQKGSEPVPATISDVPRSRDDTQEIEGPAASEVQAHPARFTSLY